MPIATLPNQVLPPAHLALRQVCPCCKGRAGTLLCSLPYTDPRIKGYLDAYYEGRVDYAYLADASYTLIECATCGLIYQQQIPDDSLLSRLYDEWISPEHSFQKPKGYPLWHYCLLAKELVDLLQAIGRRPDTIRVLDYGMGWGTWARLAQAFGCEVAGYEISQHRIAYGRSIGIPMLAWADLPNTSFDYIHTEQVFEHLTAPLETLLHLVRALRPGGIIRISVPNGRHIKRQVRRPWPAPTAVRHRLGPVIPLEHINCFRYHVIVNLGKIAGLQPVTIPSTLHMVNTAAQVPLRASLRALLRPVAEQCCKHHTALYLQKPMCHP